VSFVLDASVVLAWLLPDEQNAAAERIIERLADKGAHAPSLLLIETADALLQAERRARVPAATVDELLAAAMALPLIVEPIAAEAVVRAGAMARTHGLSVYDATYLDLAARRGLALATFDAALARAAAAQGIETVVR